MVHLSGQGVLERPAARERLLLGVIQNKRRRTKAGSDLYQTRVGTRNRQAVSLGRQRRKGRKLTCDKAQKKES